MAGNPIWNKILRYRAGFKNAEGPNREELYCARFKNVEGPEKLHEVPKNMERGEFGHKN